MYRLIYIATLLVFHNPLMAQDSTVSILLSSTHEGDVYWNENKLDFNTKFYSIQRGEHLNLKIEFKNNTDSSINILNIVSNRERNFPIAYYTIDFLGDNKYNPTFESDSLSYCTESYIDSSDFIQISPGESKRFAACCCYKTDNLSNFTQPGKYKITFNYSTILNENQLNYLADKMSEWNAQECPLCYYLDLENDISEIVDVHYGDGSPPTPMLELSKTKLELYVKLFESMQKLELKSNSIIIEIK